MNIKQTNKQTKKRLLQSNIRLSRTLKTRNLFPNTIYRSFFFVLFFACFVLYLFMLFSSDDEALNHAGLQWPVLRRKMVVCWCRGSWWSACWFGLYPPVLLWRSHTSDLRLMLWWLPCQAPGVFASMHCR